LPKADARGDADPGGAYDARRGMQIAAAVAAITRLEINSEKFKHSPFNPKGQAPGTSRLSFSGDVLQWHDPIAGNRKQELCETASHSPRFVRAELLGINCWNDPDWGADRTFYLRGMRLRIHVIAINVELYRDEKEGKTHPIIRRVTVKINAEPDKSADTELAREPTRSEPTACTQ